jgi:hypothetical protein
LYGFKPLIVKVTDTRNDLSWDDRRRDAVDSTLKQAPTMIATRIREHRKVISEITQKLSLTESPISALSHTEEPAPEHRAAHNAASLETQLEELKKEHKQLMLILLRDVTLVQRCSTIVLPFTKDMDIRGSNYYSLDSALKSYETARESWERIKTYMRITKILPDVHGTATNKGNAHKAFYDDTVRVYALYGLQPPVEQPYTSPDDTVSLMRSRYECYELMATKLRESVEAISDKMSSLFTYIGMSKEASKWTRMKEDCRSSVFKPEKTETFYRNKYFNFNKLDHYITIINSACEVFCYAKDEHIDFEFLFKMTIPQLLDPIRYMYAEIDVVKMHLLSHILTDASAMSTEDWATLERMDISDEDSTYGYIPCQKLLLPHIRDAYNPDQIIRETLRAAYERRSEWLRPPAIDTAPTNFGSRSRRDERSGRRGPRASRYV